MLKPDWRAFMIANHSVCSTNFHPVSGEFVTIARCGENAGDEFESNVLDIHLICIPIGWQLTKWFHQV